MSVRLRSAAPFLVLALFGLSTATTTGVRAQAPPSVEVADVDAVFAEFEGTRTPGCAVGVSHLGTPLLLRAYGMADLEHDVPNRPETIFEPGSVAKQFTAAATVLLALDGVISLDDDIRTYIPELPDYGEVVTIRHLLNHTSGLRDWGSIAGIEGWPRTRRAHTHVHVLDIASRQRSLNYPPGEYYSYTNTGFNLQAMLVERVSGTSFAQFTKERIFEPLGMTRTEWRDDFTRVVRNRSIAYQRNQDGSWSMLMPFEDVYGNGGLLTTVEDLLRFTWNLETGALGGPRFIEEMHRQGVLNSGQTISYASGLMIGTYKGLPQVQHSGATAGYRGHLARFPDQGIGVAVMCNASSGNASRLAYQVADLYLGDAVAGYEPPAGPEGIHLSSERLDALAGAYVDSRRGTLVRLAAADGGLRAGNTPLIPVSETRFESADGIVLTFESTPTAEGRFAAVLAASEVPDVRLEPVPPFEPTPEALQEYLGTFRSDEAETTYTVELEEGALVVKDRWGQGPTLQPLYPDAFGAGGNVFIFRRDNGGRITGASLSQSRVWDLRFRKLR